MSRRLLAVVALVALAATAGCSAIFGPPATDEEALAENHSYDWNTSANATLSLDSSSYTAIYRVENHTEFQLYDRDALGQERSVPISALRFRYPNGTVVAPSNDTLTVERGGGRTTIALPGNVTGQLAFESDRHGKSFSVPAYVQGSYNMTLPQGTRVGIPILASVSPGSFSTSMDEGRVTVHWEDVQTGQINVRWYLERDLLVFSVIVGVGLVLGAGGIVYFYRQIKRLRERREEVGLDVEQEEDDDPRDRGPPPGMR